VSVEAFFGWVKGVERLIGLVQCGGLMDYPSVGKKVKTSVVFKGDCKSCLKSFQET
jgi:hypothetical protein